MNISKKALAFAVVLFSCTQISAQSSFIARNPAISPDQNMIAFSYQGDIWTYNLNSLIPSRLTLHQAYESNPVFSSDGQNIAFSGNRYGNDDVFTVSIEGGAPNRLTYNSTGDRVTDWTSQGDVYFETRRTFRQVEWETEMYSISASGGTPQRLLNVVGEMAVASPNGRYIAFMRGSCRIEREAYNGPADMDIWLYDSKNDTYTEVTKNETNDYLPKWKSDGELLFIGAVESVYNIQSVTIGGNGEIGEVKSITKFTEDGVRHFDVAGGALVMERMDNLFIQKGEGPVQPLSIQIKSDYRFDPMEKKTYSNNVGWYSASPDGKSLAMVIRGEVFVKELDKEKKKSVNVSNHPYRDEDITWLNDTALLFISDREGGQYDIYMAESDDPKKPKIENSLKHKLTRITSTKEDEGELLISPDGKKLLFTRTAETTKLIVANINEKGSISAEKVLIDSWDNPSGMKWSPDSRFIAYSHSDLNFNSEIFVMDVEKGEATNVSMHPKGDFGPFWSEDGSKLGFISERNNGDNDVWFAWLQKEEWLKTQEDRDEGYYFEDEEKEDKKSDKKDKKKKKAKMEVKPMNIDLDNIHDRLQQVTSLPGSEGSVIISKDGETFYFTASSNVSRGRDLYSIKFDGKKIKQLTKGGKNVYAIQLDPSSDDFYVVKSGVVNKVNHAKGELTSYPHSARMVIDHEQEREQVFEEMWSALNKGFYDPNFHGKDWDKLKAKYKPWAMAATTTQDFRYISNLMLGQLNASHMGLRGGTPEQTQTDRTGRLGIEIKPVKSGVEVMHVVPNSPADREKSKLNVGDIITHVDGVAISNEINFYSLFTNERDNQILLTVKGKGGERELVIRPTSSLSNLLYEEWVADRKKLVEKYSNGRLGYIHIRGMNFTSFERFERELTASGYGKEGVVIDVRFNGGGWTTDYLMAVLNVKQHAYTVPRGAVKSLEKENEKFKDYYPYSERLPLAWWTKPSIAMCNASSYSNAEIFSHAYKNLGIGTLVGIPTFGAVISTGGKGLLDGSFVRMPFRAWYVRSTGQNMENGPAVPDIVVENAPDDKYKEKDTQLKTSVDELLKQIDSAKK